MMTRTLSLALLFVVVTWTLATNCEIEDDINENFQTNDVRTNIASAGACQLDCYADPCCDLYHYSSSDQTCKFIHRSSNNRLVYSMNYDAFSGTTFVYNAGAWKMVFRATPGGGTAISDLWESSGGYNENDASFRSINSTPSGIYKSSQIATLWPKISMMQLAMYSGGSRVVSAVYDTSGTTDTEGWYDLDRLIYSSYPDHYSHVLNSGSRQHPYNPNLRRTFVNGFYDGCNSDSFWFIIIDGNTSPPSGCSWEHLGVYPQFFYSPGSSFANAYTQELQNADVFAIYAYVMV